MSAIYYEVYMTRVLLTARISTVYSVMFVDRNKRDFELGKAIEKKFFFSSCHERGTKKKF